MIGKDGTVYYARPSHQEFLIRKAAEKEKCTRDELFDMCPAEYHCRFMNWLIDISGGFIPVWRKFFAVCCKRINERTTKCTEKAEIGRFI